MSDEIREKVIAIVVEEAYNEGIKEGRKQVLEELEKVRKAEQLPSHNPQKNIYARGNK